MVQQHETLRILFLHDAQDTAEQLINALRNAGRPTRAELALNEDQLITAIKSGHWDLLLARPEVSGLDVFTAMKHIKRLEKDLPTLVLTDEFDPDQAVKFMQGGARSVVSQSHKELLLAIVNRELDDLVCRKELHLLQLDLVDSQKRLDLLMDSSADAIAYVTDGMHIQANDAYANIFGYEDADDMAGLPIMDLIDAASHAELKEHLKIQFSDEGTQAAFDFTGKKEDGSDFSANMELSAVNFEDEPCTQILIHKQGGEGLSDAELQAKLNEATAKDSLTGIYSHQYFSDLIDLKVQAAVKSGEASSLLYVELDNLFDIRKDQGLGVSNQVLQQTAELLTSLLAKESVAARFGANCFTIWIGENDIDKMSVLGEEIRSTIESHMLEVGNKTIQQTATVSITAISESAPSGQAIFDRAIQTLEQAKEQHTKGNTVAVYNPLADTRTDVDTKIKLMLEQALEQGSFKLRYQPIMSTTDESEAIFELRLSLPGGTEELSPEDFMPTAIDARLAGKVDRWATLSAIKAMVAVHNDSYLPQVVIPLSESSLTDNSFNSWVEKALKASKLPASALIFEASESVATTYLKATQSCFEALQSIGCRTSISQFGCSIDPFKVLDHVSASLIKLDRSFGEDLGNEESKAKLKELIAVIQEREKKIAITGVESTAALQALWMMGAEYLEGSVVAAPTESLEFAFADE